MKTAAEIATLCTDRRKSAQATQMRMAELEDMVYGRLALLAGKDEAAVPNLIARGLAQLAMRVASTTPSPVFSPLRPGIKQSEQRSRDRRDVMLGWWAANGVDLGRRKRARHLLGYATSPVQLRVNFAGRRPEWVPRSPREALPAPCDGLVPDDCIFTYFRTSSWVRREYPGSLGFLVGDYPGRMPPDAKVRMIEYVSGEQVTLLAAGATGLDEHVENIDSGWSDRWSFSNATGRSTDWAVKLVEYENRAARPLVVAPWSIDLAESSGVFDQSLGLYRKQARLMALEELAIEGGIFPEPWLEPFQNSAVSPEVVTQANGRTGEVGVVKGGTLNFRKVEPGFAALQAIDRYERAIRMNAGIPAEFGGESASNVRTGRRGDSIMSATVDFDVQEAQELLSASQVEEDRCAIAIDKAYFAGSKPVNVAWNGAKTPRSYDTETTWETDDHFVRFAMAGSDQNSLVIGIGQRIGVGLMSKRTGMELDPLVSDAESEYDRVTVEALDSAGLSAIQTQAAGGQLPVSDLARIKQLILTGTSWEDAVLKAQAEAQERQASTVAPVEAGAPEAQPGLAAPGMGAEAGVAIPEPGPSQGNLAQLLNQLRGVGSSINAAESAA